MKQDESIALWRRGKDAWNAWAEDMLRQKAELQKAGTWNGDESQDEWSDETRKWNDAAQTDLSDLRFMTRALADAAEKQVGQEKSSSQPSEPDVKTLIIDGDGIEGYGIEGDSTFFNLVFPWRANFAGVEFHGEAVFAGVEFRGEAQFHGVQFHGGAHFGGARFHGSAYFPGVQFYGTAYFQEMLSLGEAVFAGARFHKLALFWGALFLGADFAGAQFHVEANFGGALFHGEAKFASAHFERSASFRDALFGSEEKPQHADFTAIKADRAFDLTGAQFSKVPAFNQADFKQAPDLDNVSFPARSFWRGGNKDLVPQYRALKRLAVQGYDYEREQMAFKGELRSRRWLIDKWYGPSVWLGMFYDSFADCGRSIWQPFVTWAALVLGFAALYFSRAADGFAPRCGSLETPALQALYLSIKNGLVLFGGTRDARINQAYLCLYGGDASQPNIPLSVTYVETLLQTPISAALLFLFLLAVRNQFKIK